MKDLMALVQLFDLRVIKKSWKPLPTIVVEIDDEKSVLLQRNHNGDIWATDRISNIPMRYIGCGGWQFKIDL